MSKMSSMRNSILNWVDNIDVIPLKNWFKSAAWKVEKLMKYHLQTVIASYAAELIW